MSGFDGAITTHSASAMRLEHAGRGPGRVGAVEADGPHRHRVLALHEVLLEADLGRLAVGAVDGQHGAEPVVGDREQAELEPPRRRRSRRSPRESGRALAAGGAVRYRWVPRSRSPRLNQVAPP